MNFTVGDRAQLINLTTELEDLYEKVGVVLKVSPGEMVSVGFGTPPEYNEDIAHVFPWEIRRVFKEGDIVHLTDEVVLLNSAYLHLVGKNGKILQEWSDDLYMVDFFTDDDELYFFSGDQLERTPNTTINASMEQITVGTFSGWNISLDGTNPR